MPKTDNPTPPEGLSPETKAALDAARPSPPETPAPLMQVYCVINLITSVTFKEKPDDSDDKAKLISLAGQGAAGMFPVFTDQAAALAFAGNDQRRIITIPLGLMAAPPTTEASSKIIRPKGVFGRRK